VYVYDFVRVCVTVLVYMYQYTEVALPAEGSVPITTSDAGGTAFASAAKPKNRATAHASVMRLEFCIVERARVRLGVGERVYAGAMATVGMSGRDITIYEHICMYGEVRAPFAASKPYATRGASVTSPPRRGLDA
jgi:hypothetical protein